MSAIINIDMENRLTVDGHELPVGTFIFRRSNDAVYFGRGDWVVVEARSTNLKPGTILSLQDQFYLTQKAKEIGLVESHNFARAIPPRPKPVRQVREKNSKGKGILVNFNPFKV